GMLGYFDEYPKASTLLGERLSAVGLAPPAFDGVFMYDPIHPTEEATWALGRSICRKIGSSPGDGEPPRLRGSGLEWPVYPEIAPRLGLTGALTFRGIDGRQFGLGEVIAREYERYGAAASPLRDTPEGAEAAERLGAFLYQPDGIVRCPTRI